MDVEALVAGRSRDHEAPWRVTIIMPALNEQAFIARAIASLLPCSSRIDCELIVVDGGSSDGTEAVVRDLSRADPRIRLVRNERRIQAAAVNLGARAARPQSEFLLRADCHALYPPNFVERCLEALLAHGAASVVVPMRADGEGWLQKAIASAQNSRLGNGGAAHRQGRLSGFVDHGHHAAFDRRVFEALGGYDETFVCNEDAELDTRIGAANGMIYLLADAEITYFPRSTLGSLARQYFKYGIGRAKTVMKHAARPRPRQLLPVAALLACVLGLGLSALDARALMLPLAYVALCVAWGMAIALRRGEAGAAGSGIAAITMHMSWALGFLLGVTRSWLAPPLGVLTPIPKA